MPTLAPSVSTDVLDFLYKVLRETRWQYAMQLPEEISNKKKGKTKNRQTDRVKSTGLLTMHI